MSERPTVSVSTEIEEAQEQFENWRRGRKRGERIPADLWATAVALAKQHGVWPTAKALHLDHSRLKRRVRNGEEPALRMRAGQQPWADSRADGRAEMPQDGDGCGSRVG